MDIVVQLMNPPNPGGGIPGLRGFGPNLPWVLWNSYYVLLAYFVFVFLCPLDRATAIYKGGGHALQEHLVWMTFVLARNLGLAQLVYSAWHNLMYVQLVVPLEKKLNPKMPADEQHQRDRFWVLSGTCIASLFEMGMTHLWASGKLPVLATLSEAPGLSAALFVLAWVWSDLHFYFVHRMMHPTYPAGQKTVFGDPGKLLYRHVHSLHHKSYNPG